MASDRDVVRVRYVVSDGDEKGRATVKVGSEGGEDDEVDGEKMMVMEEG